MSLVFQTMLGAAGSVGFALLFNIRGVKLAWIGAGGALGWVVYSLTSPRGGVFAAMLAATAAVALCSEVLARRLKAPVILLLVPMLIPLIPGRDLYAMMSALVRGEQAVLAQRAQLLALQAGAIALGVICLSSAVNIVQGLCCGAARDGKKDTTSWKS